MCAFKYIKFKSISLISVTANERSPQTPKSSQDISVTCVQRNHMSVHFGFSLYSVSS